MPKDSYVIRCRSYHDAPEFTLGSPSLRGSVQPLEPDRNLLHLGMCWDLHTYWRETAAAQKEAQLPGCISEAPIRQMLTAAMPGFSKAIHTASPAETKAAAQLEQASTSPESQA